MRLIATIAILACMVCIPACRSQQQQQQQPPMDSAPPPIVIGVNEPFCRQTGSNCVGKDRYREYEGLARLMSDTAGRPVKLRYFWTEPELIKAAAAGEIQGVICKTWPAMKAAKAAGRKLDRLADVSMPGKVFVKNAGLRGEPVNIVLPGPEKLGAVLFTCGGSGINSLKDLAGKRVAIGNEDSYEKSYSVRRVLFAAGVTPKYVVIPTCVSAAAAVAEGEVDAAVISNYAFMFGTLEAVGLNFVPPPPAAVDLLPPLPGSVPVSGPTSVPEPGPTYAVELGATEPIPFVTIGLFDNVDAGVRDRVRKLLAMPAGGWPADLGETKIMPPADWQPTELK